MLRRAAPATAARRCCASLAAPPPAVTATALPPSPPAPVSFYDLSHQLVPYTTAWGWQQAMLRARTHAAGTGGPDVPLSPAACALPDVLFALQHPPVFTLGRGATRAHLRFDPDSPGDLAALGAEVHTVERGGKVTFHGPGQLVLYPVLTLGRRGAPPSHAAAFPRDLHWYVRSLEEVLIRTLGEWGLRGERAPGLPGVWVGDRKVAAVGMSCSKWVTTHGAALNVAPDMAHFARIVPCGIYDKEVTSMAAELRAPVAMADVAAASARHFADVFRASLVPASGDPAAADAAALEAAAAAAGDGGRGVR